MCSKYLSFFKLHFPNQWPKDGRKPHAVADRDDLSLFPISSVPV